MQRLVILRGIPASGKSTYAKQICTQPGWLRTNKDDLRLMTGCSAYDKFTSQLMNDLEEELIRTALKAGMNVVSDNTNLQTKTIKRLHKLALEIGDITVDEQFFVTPLAVCLERNSLRTGVAHVPENIILAMDKQLKKLIPSNVTLDQNHVFCKQWLYAKPKPYVADSSLPKAIICDLDGTLALLNERDPYNAASCEDDQVCLPVYNCVMLFLKANYKILFVTGREDVYHEPTVKFLSKCGFNKLNYKLFMRSTRDVRPDGIVKLEIFDRYIRNNYNVSFTLDDRNSVVAMWRNLGLKCFQVAEGDF